MSQQVRRALKYLKWDLKEGRMRRLKFTWRSASPASFVLCNSASTDPDTPVSFEQQLERSRHVLTRAFVPPSPADPSI